MKFASSFVALVIAAIAPSVVAQSSTLEQKWAINDEPAFTYSSLDFSLTFKVSDFIIPGQAKHTLYTQGCKEDGSPLPASGSGIINTGLTDTPNTVSNTGIVALNQNVTIKMSVDPTTISGNTALYTANNTVGAVSAKVVFCVRFGLNTASAIEVNFLETVITLDIDLSDGFQIAAVAVEPRDKLVRTAAQAYQVEGYLCGNNRNALPAADLAAIRNQGALIRVCVRPNAEARADGVYMRSVDSFSWKRANPVADITQEAVVNRQESSNALTTLVCTAGQMVCYFESILFAAFYTTLGQVTGAGVASMQFGGNGDSIDANGNLVVATARNLRDATSRGLQEGEEAATSEFDLSFDVDQGTGAQYADNSGAGSTAAFGTMAMALIGLVGAVAV